MDDECPKCGADGMYGDSEYCSYRCYGYQYADGTFIQSHACRIRVLEAELHECKAASDSQDRREREAGERCGVSYETHGCDWPDAAAERIVFLRAEVKRLRQSGPNLEELCEGRGPTNLAAIYVDDAGTRAAIGAAQDERDEERRRTQGVELEVKRLQAIVDKLPKAGGKFGAGDTCWGVANGKVVRCRVVSFVKVVAVDPPSLSEFDLGLEQYYPNRDAAEEARDK